MAENVILKTQILLRNDTAANWTAANPVLGQGEVGLETDTKKFKVGDGTTAWNSLDYYNANYTDADEVIQLIGSSLNGYSTTDQMNQAIEDAIGEIPSVDLSSVTNTHREVSSKEALDAIATEDLVKGDTAVVKTPIATDIYSYTAYVWNGTAWAAMDGNYNADNVYVGSAITLAGNYDRIGNYEKGRTINAGTSVADILSGIFTARLQPVVDYPTVTLTTTANGTGEVGTTFSLPTATLTITDIGSYEYGSKTYNEGSGDLTTNSPEETGVRFPAEKVVITGWDSAKEANEKTVSNASIFTKGDKITLTPDSKGTTYTENTITYDFSATAEFKPDPNTKPLDNLGGYAEDEYRIGYDTDATGTETVTVTGNPKSVTFTGFRKMFWGTMTTKPTTMTSTDIRALSGLQDGNKNNGIKVATGERSLTIPVGCYRVVIAVPAARTLSKVLDVNDSNANIVGSFKSTTIDVVGANNYAATAYTVYYLDYANANDQANTYKVTIA